MASARLLVSLALACFVGNAAGRVTIRSTQAGLSFQDRSLTFACAPDFQSAKSGRCALLRRVLSAIGSPRAEYSPESLGITPAWLTANVDAAVEQDLQDYFRPSQDQIRLFRNTFLDPARTGELVRRFRAFHTDDYPSFVLEAYDSDGTHIIIQSKDQSICMLPWEIESHGRQYIAYDRRIGDAILALLPKHFPNRDKIGGTYLREEFSRGVLYEIKSEWDLLGNKARGR